MLIGDGNRNLGFHLEVLVFHVEDDLFDHFFRVLGAIDHIVEIGAD